MGLALRRSGVDYCCVTGPAIVLRHADRSVRAVLLSATVRQWINEFDGQRPVGPVQFELGLPVSAMCGCSTASAAVPSECPRLTALAERQLKPVAGR